MLVSSDAFPEAIRRAYPAGACGLREVLCPDPTDHHIHYQVPAVRHQTKIPQCLSLFSTPPQDSCLCWLSAIQSSNNLQKRGSPLFVAKRFSSLPFSLAGTTLLQIAPSTSDRIKHCTKDYFYLASLAHPNQRFYPASLHNGQPTCEES